MNNLDNFKDITEDMLKDIKVSEDLKRRTLERCKKEAQGKRRFIIPSAVAGVAAVLALVMLNSHLLPLDRNGKEDKTEIIMGTSEESGKGSQANVAKGEDSSIDPNEGISNDNQILQATDNPVHSGAGQSTEPSQGTGKPIYEPGTIEEAKKYMGADFKMPEYIPSNFKLGLVQVPTDIDKEGFDIMISYEEDNVFYTLTMRKGVTSLDNFVGNKEIDINGVKAKIVSGPLMADNEVAAPVFTQMRWLSNNVLYIIEGQISEEEAVKVARSIK